MARNGGTVLPPLPEAETLKNLHRISEGFLM
jgi:hypothetical protein